MQNHLQILNEQCIRYQKIMQLPACEREKFSTGISKLETQIEQLRQATGMDIDTFCKGLQAALSGFDVVTDETADYVSSLLDEASRCYNIGDKQSLLECFSQIKSYIGGLRSA